MTSKVQRVSALHREAMEYTDESFVARGLNERDEYLRLTRLAFEKESAAADLLANEKVEPSRAILHRSAATLAYRCEKHEEAKRLIHRALAGSPPMDIEAELEELLGRVKLAMEGIQLTEQQVRLTLDGNEVGHGRALADSVVSRISSARQLIQISANFDLPVFIDTVGAGSFYVVLTVGRVNQPILPGFADNDNLIAPLLENLKLLFSGDYSGLQTRIEDPEDYRSFVRAATRLAPDGRSVSSVNLQATIGNRVESVDVTQSREELRTVPVPDLQRIYSKTDREVSQTGVLKVADAQDVAHCILIQERKLPWSLEVQEDQLNEILGKFFNKPVEVTGKRMKLTKPVRRIYLERPEGIRLLAS